MTISRRKYAVGFIGIGKMGLAMSSRIAAHGYPFRVQPGADAKGYRYCYRPVEETGLEDPAG